MKKGTPGLTKTYDERNGGYINHLFPSQQLRTHGDNNPGDTYEDHMFTEEEAEQMLDDANAFIQKYYPWMKDFVIFQFSDGTIRLDVSNRAFLGGG